MTTSAVGEGDGERASLLEVARLRIAHTRLDDFDDLKRAMVAACRVSASSLGVARVGIWSVEEAGSSLRRVLLHDARIADETVPDTWTLPLEHWAAYKTAVMSRRVVAATDARTDPRTCELSDEYLEPHGIGSMLDAPIFVGGEVWGIVCHEHVGAARVWTAREIDFAVSVTDMLSAMLEQAMRLALEERLRVAEGELARNREAEAVVKTAAAIGHDINTLLQAISAQAELAARSNSAEPSSLLSGIMEDCQRAARVVDQLRELQRPSPGVGAETDLSFVIEDTRTTLESLLGEGYRFELELAASAGVPARRADVERIVLNLVVNAKEAMPDGGSVRLFVRTTAASVSLEVSDEGKGITAEHASRVFEPYFTTKSGRNSGLGLFAVQTIARRTGASVNIESTPGSGTSVRVTWQRA